MPPLPETILLVLAPVAPLFSRRVWLHTQTLLVGALLAPGTRTVTAALRAVGLAAERHFTNDHRVLNRAAWSTRQGRRRLLGVRLTVWVPPGVTIVLGADDTVERRRGRRIKAKGGDRAAVRSTKKPVLRGFGRQWGSMLLLVPVPWSRRVWARPCLTAWCWPAGKGTRRRHKTRVDWVRQMRTQGRRWLPGRRLVWVVAGGVAAVSLALAGVKPPVVMVSRLRWEAALSHRPGPQPPGTRGPKPLKGTRQRRVQAWAERSDTPWDTVEVDGYGGQRKTLGVFSHTALWYTPRRPPVAIRDVLVADPEGQRRMEACFCTDLQATPVEILPWGVRRWSVEGTFAEARAHLGVETHRQWSEKALARTSPVLLGLFSLVTVLALQRSRGGQIPMPATAWSQKDDPTFADCVALVRWHLWRARYVVNSTAEADCIQFPREVFELLLNGLHLAA